MNKQMIVCAAALMSVASVAFAAQPSDGLTGAKNSSASESAIIVSTIRQQQLHQQNIDLAFAPIKSQVDLNHYLSTTKNAKSPFRYLPKFNKQMFLKSLQFGPKGLSTFNYKALVSAGLSASQIREILSLFGMQGLVPMFKGARILDKTDKLLMSSPSLIKSGYVGYRCVKHGACAAAPDMVCTDNC